MRSWELVKLGAQAILRGPTDREEPSVVIRSEGRLSEIVGEVEWVLSTEEDEDLRHLSSGDVFQMRDGAIVLEGEIEHVDRDGETITLRGPITTIGDQ